MWDVLALMSVQEVLWLEAWGKGLSSCLKLHGRFVLAACEAQAAVKRIY